MYTKEARIREYFKAWLKQDIESLDRLFSPEAFYRECYGPEYVGLSEIRRWFADWNRRGRVLSWDILRFIHHADEVIVEWEFCCEYDGAPDRFDGISVVAFDEQDRIISIKEYGSKAEHIRPYAPACSQASEV